MTPQNTSERKSSFGYFLIFFVITIALVVLAVFFGIQVPSKENETLKAEIADMQKDENFMQDFTKKVSDTQNLLDSVNRPGVRPELVDGSISNSITTLASLAKNDSVHQNICNIIVQGLSDLQTVKQQLRDKGGNDATITSLQQQINDYKNQLMQANSTITNQNIALRNCK